MIRSKHPHCGALPVPYVPVPVIRGALAAYLYSYAPPRSTFIPLSVSLWNDLPTLYSMVWDWRVSRAGLVLFFIGLSCFIPFCLLGFFPFLFFVSICCYCWTSVFGLIWCTSHSPSLHCRPHLVLKIIKIIYKDFLPPPRMGSHVKSDNTHNHKHNPLAHIIIRILIRLSITHILDTCALIFNSYAIFTVYPNRIM